MLLVVVRVEVSLLSLLHQLRRHDLVVAVVVVDDRLVVVEVGHWLRLNILHVLHHHILLID